MARGTNVDTRSNQFLVEQSTTETGRDMLAAPEQSEEPVASVSSTAAVAAVGTHIDYQMILVQQMRHEMPGTLASAAVVVGRSRRSTRIARIALELSSGLQ
eukprot:3775124-Amphidinium_carterae.1